MLMSLYLPPYLAKAQQQRQPAVKPGVDVFLEQYAYLVRGKRVGLITNQTGVSADGTSTIDLLHRDQRVNLVALFSPEHGIRGTAAAGEHIGDSTDPKTGLHVYSLYGLKGRKPTPEMLRNLDVLIYDIQDVGSRAYTYIWTMANCMKAAAENDLFFIVLDRPNPLGGHVIDGPTTEPKWESFLGLYPIPRVYGMTPGELAYYFNEEHGINAAIGIIPMHGYNRSMSFAETGLPWIPSSPNIPTPESAVAFAATGTIGTLGFIHIGIGTDYPFQLVGATWMDSQRSASILNSRQLPGVQFVPYRFPGKDGRAVECVFLQVTDPAQFWPTTTETVILEHLQSAYSAHFRWPGGKTANSFDKATGTSTLRENLQRGLPVNSITASWQRDLSSFDNRRRAYFIYP